MRSELDPGEQAAILATFDSLDHPSPVNYSPVGIPLVLVAVIAYWAIIKGASWAGLILPPGVTTALFILAVIAVIAGGLLALLGGAFVGLQPTKNAELALQVLQDKGTGPGHVEARRRASVMLVANGYYSGGPWMRATFDADEVRAILGPALPYVEAVERVLRAGRRAYPVFTPVEDPDLAPDDERPPT